MFSRIASRLLSPLHTQPILRAKFSSTTTPETLIPTLPTSPYVFPVSPRMTNYQDIRPALKPYITQLMAHPIYNAIKGIEECQVFMESHAFAVWDFMTLLKTLQINLTCVSLPWVPPKDPELAYFINSIVSGEESDDLGTQNHTKATSHYKLYLTSMEEIGANIGAISFFVNNIQGGLSWKDSMAKAKEKFPHIPVNTFEFVEYTMQVAQYGSVPEVAACFLFGREDPIPTMYQKLLAKFNEKNIKCPNLRLYLARHIEVDGDQHAPMADLLLEKLCTDTEKCEKALKVAQDSIKMRMHLWDGIYAKIK